METRYGTSPAKRIRLLEIEKRKMISESSFLSSNPSSSHLPSASTKPSSSSVNLDAAFLFSQESLASSQEPFTKYVANNLNVGKDKAMQSVTNQSKHQKNMRMKQHKIIVGRRGIRHAWKEKINEIKNRSVLDPVIYPGSSSNKEMKRRTG